MKWCWPDGLGTSHCVLCIQMFCFTAEENQYTLCLTLGTQLQYTSFHEQYCTIVTCVFGKKGALLSTGWCTARVWSSASDLGNCVYVNIWFLLCTCAIFNCVFIGSMFQNDLCNEPVIILWNVVDLLALCCILPKWLVTSTLQCIPLHHKMSAYGGMISDILTVRGFLISLPFSSTEMTLQSTIILLCWWIV